MYPGDRRQDERTPAPLAQGRLCGLLNVNKPGGPTSRDVVDRVARLVRPAKVGHAGTLDPLASGVLVVCVGAATRLVDHVQRMGKTYRTVVLLGARSDTLDADGRVESVPGAQAPDESAVRAVLAGQVGTIAQVPPQFSALKVQGQRAYDLARKGKPVDLAARPVTIHRVSLISYAWPRLELEIDCGSGTFIRSIARDVGEALGCGGLVEVLVRTRIGPFRLEDAVDPRALTAESLTAYLRPAIDAVPDLPCVRLDAAGLAAVAQGRAIAAPAAAGPGQGPALAVGGEVALVGPDGSLVAVGELDASTGQIHPRKVFVGAG